MIVVGEEERLSGVRLNSIDYDANLRAIQAMLEAVMPLGHPITNEAIGKERPDVSADYLGQHWNHLPLERRRRFPVEKFEKRIAKRQAGTAVDLAMKPTDGSMYGRFYDLGALGLRSLDRIGSGLQNGTLLATMSLRNDGPNRVLLEGVDRTALDIDFHSIGAVIVRGHIYTRHNDQTAFWDELHFDELTPLSPDTNHEIIYEQVGNRQVTALAAYVLERLPE